MPNRPLRSVLAVFSCGLALSLAHCSDGAAQREGKGAAGEPPAVEAGAGGDSLASGGAAVSEGGAAAAPAGGTPGEAGAGGEATAAGAGGAPECLSGERVCDGQQVQVCLEGRFAAGKLCVDQACVDGFCAGVCEPGQRRCADGDNLVETCSAAGLWEPGETCSDATCLEGACQGECAAGQSACFDGVPASCSASGQWEPGEPCAGQTCVEGVCQGECAAGARGCDSENATTLCDAAGAWQKVATCSGSTCVAGTCQGSCVTGSRQCAGSVPQTCSANGSWDNAAACVDQACVGGVCQGRCSPGATRCTSQSGHDLQQTCDATGEWQNSSACPGQTCLGTACQGECKFGSTRCVDNEAWSCNVQASWELELDCGDYSTCTSQGCTGECGPAEQQCSVTAIALQACAASGNFGANQPCPEHQRCIARQVPGQPREALCSCGWLYEDYFMTAGHRLYSCDGRFVLVVSEGRLDLVDWQTNPNSAIWSVSGPPGVPITDTYLVMQGDGNLVLYGTGCTGPNSSCWSSGTGGLPGNRFVVQEDGNLVIYGPNCPPPWGACWSRYG